jgi:hypothetical protein
VATTEAPPAVPVRSFPRWRRILAWVCIIISCILVPLSIIAIWARNEILNTDDYVRTVAPLARDPDIQTAVSVRLTNTLFEEVDVEEIAADALPERAAFLAGPLATALRDFAQQATLRFLESEAFQTIWDEANRLAHEQVERALTGGGPLLSTDEGRVVLDLTPLVDRVRAELSDRGIGVFDNIPIERLALRFELFDAEGLESAQAGVRLLDRLRIVLPVLSLVFAAVGIWLARDRRRALMRWGIGVAIATLVLGFALSFGRDFYLDHLPEDSNRSAAAAAFDIVLRYMRDSNRVVFLVGLLIGVGAFVAGSGRIASAIRGRTTAALDVAGERAAASGERFDLGGVARFVARFAGVLRAAGVVVVFVVLLAMDHPDGVTVLVLLGFLLLYLAAVGVLERVARDRPAPGQVSNAAQ